jgi:hypothetical protein
MRYALEKHGFLKITVVLVFITLLAVAIGGCPLLADHCVCGVAKQSVAFP